MNTHYHRAETNINLSFKHMLLYHYSVDGSIKPSRVTFPESEVVTEMFHGWTTEEFWQQMCWSYSIKLILTDLTNKRAFYNISDDVSNHSNKNMVFLALQYFALKIWVLHCHLDFYKNFNQSTENTNKNCRFLIPYLNAD